MKNERVLVLAKEKYGLKDAVSFLRKHFRVVRLFTGKRGDPFPREALFGSWDICVSYMSPWIVPAGLLSAVRKFSINFHPGPPEYRGIGCTNFALYEGVSGYGVTAHLMAPHVDSGKIISVKRFPIRPQDTLVGLTDKCYRSIALEFRKVFSHYLRYGRLPCSQAVWSKRLCTRAELDRLCRVSADMDQRELARRIRATDFPGMPRASLVLFGHCFEYKGPSRHG